MTNRASTRRALATVLLLLAGCGSDTAVTEDPVPSANRTESAPTSAALQLWNEACKEAELSGEALAAIGEDPLNADLYEVDLCPFTMEKVPGVSRVSAVSAADGVVAVVSARDRVDRMDLLADGALVPVPGLGAAHVFTPSVSTSGTIAFLFVDSADGGTRVETIDPANGDRSVRFDTPGNLAFTAWGPGERIATVEYGSADGKDQVLVLPSTGDPVRIPLPYDSGTTAGLAWGANSPIAVTTSSSAADVDGMIIDPVEGEVIARIPAEWKVRAWTNGGRTLLLKHKDSATLGVVRAGDWDEVVPVGAFPAGPVWGLALLQR